LWSGLRFLLVGRQRRTRELLREHLDARPGERVLDLCCGVGDFAGDAGAHVLGLDLDPAFVHVARRRYRGRPGFDFEVGDALRTRFPDGHFDHAYFVNGLHHFSDEQAHVLLLELRRVTRGRVVVIDADGTRVGWIRPLLFRLDRGRFMRTPAEHEALLARVFQVRRRAAWTVGLYGEVLYECRAL
jgi:demethylmenaquinone methyltransferase/2-methoxy-6-polyprenyl-1,4-benzoquinol methylase